MLHIIRNFNISKAYLFLTYETNEFDLKDNRYERLAKRVRPEITIEKLRHPEIKNANNFSIYDEHFRRYLINIHSSNKDARILVNVTSGTAQMIASLYMLAAILPFPITLVQVDSFEHRANRSPHGADSFNVENAIENLMEEVLDKEEIENRCHIVTPDNIYKAFLSNAIKNQIQSYDYIGAYQLMKMDKEEYLPKQTKDLLEIAYERWQMHYQEMVRFNRELEKECRLSIIEEGNILPVYEAVLRMGVLQKRSSLLEYARSFTPIMTNMLICYIEKVHKIDIKNKYCTYDRRKDTHILNANKLPQEILDNYYNPEFGGGYHDSPLAIVNMLPLITYLQKNGKKSSIDFLKLREVEEHIRHKAAHELISLDEEDIKKKVGITVQSITRMVQKLFIETFSGYKGKVDWNSYETMNNMILESLYKMD